MRYAISTADLSTSGGICYLGIAGKIDAKQMLARDPATTLDPLSKRRTACKRFGKHYCDIAE